MRCALILLAACGGGHAQPDAIGIDTPTARIDAAPAIDAPTDATGCPALTSVGSDELVIAGDTGSTLGIFDPAMVYPAGASAGVLAYSSVPTQQTIRTRIAGSTDGGATWTFLVEANQPEATAIASPECANNLCTGNLISEVSSLIIDPLEPDAQKRWKLFAHRYLVGPQVELHYTIGTIALQTAPAPQGPWTAPQKLIGWNGSSAYSSTGVAVNVNTLAGMADCFALSEPSALVLPSSIELAVGCVYMAGGATKIRIALLRSVDHAASWQPVSTLVGPGDASCLTPGGNMNAPNLFVANNVEYLAATPDASGYTGCLVFRVDDIVAGHVASPPVKALVPSPATFAGACTFGEAGGGFLMARGMFGDPRPFRIVRAGAFP